MGCLGVMGQVVFLCAFMEITYMCNLLSALVYSTLYILLPYIRTIEHTGHPLKAIIVIIIAFYGLTDDCGGSECDGY